VISEYDGYWYWGRATLHELAADLRTATKRIRADYDAPAG
jgi:hypothetical protein